MLERWFTGRQARLKKKMQFGVKEETETGDSSLTYIRSKRSRQRAVQQGCGKIRGIDGPGRDIEGRDTIPANEMLSILWLLCSFLILSCFPNGRNQLSRPVPITAER